MTGLHRPLLALPSSHRLESSPGRIRTPIFQMTPDCAHGDHLRHRAVTSCGKRAPVSPPRLKVLQPRSTTESGSRLHHNHAQVFCVARRTDAAPAQREKQPNAWAHTPMRPSITRLARLRVSASSLATGHRGPIGPAGRTIRVVVPRLWIWHQDFACNLVRHASFAVQASRLRTHTHPFRPPPLRYI